MESIQTTLTAHDIRCEGCATAARAALQTVPGVRAATVNLPEQTVSVSHEPGVARRALAEALTRAGFPAE